MKFNQITFILIFTFLFYGMSNAQQVRISPVPQSITWGSKAFDNSVSFKITGSEDADVDAVKLLQNKLSISTSGAVEIIIGQKGQAAIQAVESKIPNKSEGYFLDVQSDKVYIAGADSMGTYYGVQTLLQILAASEVMKVTISDYPLVSERGLIEGFYGNPFSFDDRVSQFVFYGQNKMNTYIYGPKDDPYHGFGNKWRDPYPTREANRMKQLIEKAHENKVKFVWAVHPGNHIFWDDKDGDGVIDDFVAAKNKFEAMYGLGVRSFAVFFDDIGGIGADARNQAKLMNYLTNEFVKKKPDVDPLIICPTQYNQSYAGGDYLNILGDEMDESVRIMWTGQGVVRMIDENTMTWINSRIKRKAYIWLNYPVTDYLIDRLLMGPFYGNSKNIDHLLGGYVANPMEYGEASKVALFSIADYAWNMKDYNENASWEHAMRFLMPDNYDAFKVFCENNVDLGNTAHGMRRKDESKTFITDADPFLNKYMKGEYNNEEAAVVKNHFITIQNSMVELLNSTTSPALIEEIKPWVQVFNYIGMKGEVMMNMFDNIQNEEPELFVENYLRLDSIDKVKDVIRSRDFPGSIKNPFPKPANHVVVPYLKKFLNVLVNDYRSKFDYGSEVFPKTVLENGTYFIKYNGRYLTNARGSSNPSFVEKRDDTNPQRQEWVINMDAETGRFSIISSEDSRYVNELGNFTKSNTTNPYEAAWHSYNIFRLNGKYAIQNGGSAGDNLWTANATRISKGSQKEASSETFIFEIIPTSGDNPEHAILEVGENYFIKHEGLYLTNNNPKGSGQTPTFNELNENNKSAQEWIFTVDTQSKRFKLVSAADNRYVNELGVFGTNPFYSTWNTYLISEVDGKYSIRNAGEAGTQYWGINNGRIERGGLSLQESYLFEIISSNPNTSVKDVLEVSNSKLSIAGNRLTLSSDNTVSVMQLYGLNGSVIREVFNNCNMNIAGLNKGFYLLTVQFSNKSKETFKVLVN